MATSGRHKLSHVAVLGSRRGEGNKVPASAGRLRVHLARRGGDWRILTAFAHGGIMAETSVSGDAQRFTNRGDEAGTSPGDRKWRPDVEGLRAVAIALVVCLHYRLFGLVGGYVGVDVFFVVSGFVITGVLLREHKSTGKNSLIDFYARRCRRILPAALLVILVAVLATYALVGTRFGNETANEGRWASAFAFNFHYFFPGWNPLPALANYWSLAVEEQFYLVYPALFLLVAAMKGPALRARLAIMLGAVIVASYSLSIIQTRTGQGWAFFSPLTRAWELALGGLIAVATPWLLKTPKHLAALLTWLGLAVIVYSAVAFPSVTNTVFGPPRADYPGWRVAVPVIATALIIAGGIVVPPWGVERLIGTAPFRWLGKRSYSLYLWHWPVLIVASEWAGSASLWGLRVPALAVSVILTVATYRLLENPIRHRRDPSRRTVQIGLGASAGMILLLTLLIALA